MLSVDLELGTASGTRVGATEEHSTKQRKSGSQNLTHQTVMGSSPAHDEGTHNTHRPWVYIPPSRLGLSEPSRSSHNLIRLTRVEYHYLRVESRTAHLESRAIPVKVRIDDVDYNCAEVLDAQNYGIATFPVIPHSEALMRTINDALIENLKAALFDKRTERDFIIDSTGTSHLLR